jgi:pimeloyl-ACP methyl ester carboxylesterase
VSVDSIHVVEGLRTRVRVRGDGPPLLLLGGLWSQVPMWDKVLPFLDGFRTIAFDPPGIGATDLPPWPYPVRHLARFASRVLDAVGVERAHVLGVSLGGVVAQELARSFPDRVDRLVLVSTGPGNLGVPGRPDVLLRFARPKAYADRRALQQDAGRLFGGRMRVQPELVHGWHLRPPADLRAWVFRLAGTAGWTSLPWLHRLRTETLVLHGDDDPIVPLANARIIAGLVPGARLHVVHGGGHLLLLDSAADVLPVVTGFLTAATGRPTTSRPHQRATEARPDHPRKECAP